MLSKWKVIIDEQNRISTIQNKSPLKIIVLTIAQKPKVTIMEKSNSYKWCDPVGTDPSQIINISKAIEK